LIAPAGAFAHGRSPTVAIDYRLELAPAPAGLAVRILDGDRDLSVSVRRGTTLLVRGVLREPMLRIGPGGVFVNAASPTAQSDKLVATGSGWKRVNSASSYTWHEHRLAPAGQSGRFAIPVELDGRASAIAGTFVRVSKPALWPWLGFGAVLAAATALVARRRSLRLPLAVVLAAAGGTAAFAATVTFALRDRPTGGVAWLPVGAAIGVALALGVPLVRLHGRRRGQAAGLAGAVAAAVVIETLPVFWHGEVISALPGNVARLACALALVGGACAAAVSLLPEFDG
jgi:hypothetical protein